MPQYLLTDEAITGLTPDGTMRHSFAALPIRVMLGCVLPAVQRANALRLSDFVNPAALNLPPSTNYADKAMVSLNRMYLNDKMGCCVISGKYHNVGLWSGNDTDTVIVGTDQEVYQNYLKLKAGPGDSGCIITRVLDYMRTTGLPFNGAIHKIDGYVSFDWTNKQLVQAAQYLFGATTIGIRLPQEWLSKAVWDVTNSPIVGGHDVSPVDYREDGVIVSSWGRLYRMTWNAFLSQRYTMEAYAMLAPSWYNSDLLAPNKVNTSKLREALSKVGQGSLPDIDVTPPPTPGNNWTVKTAGPVTITGTGTKPVVS